MLPLPDSRADLEDRESTGLSSPGMTRMALPLSPTVSAETRGRGSLQHRGWGLQDWDHPRLSQLPPERVLLPPHHWPLRPP